MTSFLHLAVVILIAGSPIAQASDDVLSLHLSCNTKEGCVTLEKEDGMVAVVMPDSSLVLDSNSVTKAYINPDSNVTVELSEAASLTLAKVTAEGVGRQMAIVLRERVLANPTIKAPIYSGRLEIAADRPSEPPYWETLPWLFTKLYPDREVPRHYPGLKKAFRLTLAVLPLVIVVAVIVVRVRNRRRSLKASP